MELEPCPLCGSTDVIVWEAPEDAWGVGCNECGVSLQRATEAEAIAAWSRRAGGGQAGGGEDQGSSVAESAAVSQEARPEGSEVAGKWRKRPVVIDAWQWTGESLGGAPEWLSDVERVYGDFTVGTVRRAGAELNIETLEGTMVAQRGDWIIRGVAGELYACKPDIFAQTYEPATPADRGADVGEAVVPRPAKATPDEHVPAPAGEVEPVAYDAGILSAYGGGNVEWWQDYIRAELGRAHDHYAVQAASALTALQAENARLREALEPFAAKLADIGEDEDDQDGFAEMSPANRRAPRITVGDFRRARAALEGR